VGLYPVLLNVLAIRYRTQKMLSDPFKVIFTYDYMGSSELGASCIRFPNRIFGNLYIKWIKIVI